LAQWTVHLGFTSFRKGLMGHHYARKPNTLDWLLATRSTLSVI